MYSAPFIIGVFLIAALVLVSVHERYKVEREMSLKLEVKQREFEALKQRAQTLEANVEHLRDDRGIEEEIRNRFDVAKEGEQVVVIIDDVPPEKQVTPIETNVIQKTFMESVADVLKFW